MFNTWLVLKHEVITTLQKRSFWVLTILFPAFILTLTIGVELIGAKALEKAEEEASSVEAQAQANTGVGYVDEPGVITEIPSWIPSSFFQEYPSQEAADKALVAGEIRQYYLIPADFLETGEYLLVDQEYQPIRSLNNAEIFQAVLHDALTAQVEFGELLQEPIAHVQQHQLRASTKLDQSDPMAALVPVATLFIFFLTITSSSGFMLTSVTKEKENRTAEILLLSIRPRQLMLGKVIGLGLVALLQMAVWMGGMFFSISRSRDLLETASTFQFPPGFLLWGLVYFLFGYFMFASLLGALGTLAPNAREGNQFVFFILLPLMIPLWFNTAFVTNPNGGIALFLSLFPLTAISMMTRIAIGEVPMWQILMSLGGLALTTYLAVVLSARFFKAENLLSGESINFKRLFRAFTR